MFLSNLSIKRPVFATVMMLALVTLGAFSFRRLAIDMMPDVEIPVLSIAICLSLSGPGLVVTIPPAMPQCRRLARPAGRAIVLATV